MTLCILKSIYFFLFVHPANINLFDDSILSPLNPFNKKWIFSMSQQDRYEYVMKKCCHKQLLKWLGKIILV